MSLGRYEDEMASHNKALEIKPNSFWAWYYQGYILLYRLNRYQDAMNSIGKALQLQPNDYDSWNNNGYGLSKLGQHEEAITIFETIETNLSTKPSSPGATKSTFLNLSFSGS